MNAGGGIYFVSDTHFQHKFVAGLRGFSSPEEHDECVIANWNRHVTPNDLVWHLGDVGLGNEDALLEKVQRLNGHIQLVTGNHDRVWPGHRDARKHQRKWMEVFESVQAYARIRVRGESVLLSHFPYEGDHTTEPRYTQYRLRDEGLWLIHGHTHSTSKISRGYTLPFFFGQTEPVYRGKQIHVGMDAWDMTPVPMGEVEKFLVV